MTTIYGKDYSRLVGRIAGLQSNTRRAEEIYSIKDCNPPQQQLQSHTNTDSEFVKQTGINEPLEKNIKPTEEGAKINEETENVESVAYGKDIVNFKREAELSKETAEQDLENRALKFEPQKDTLTTRPYNTNDPNNSPNGEATNNFIKSLKERNQY